MEKQKSIAHIVSKEITGSQAGMSIWRFLDLNEFDTINRRVWSYGISSVHHNVNITITPIRLDLLDTTHRKWRNNTLL